MMVVSLGKLGLNAGPVAPLNDGSAQPIEEPRLNRDEMIQELAKHGYLLNDSDVVSLGVDSTPVAGSRMRYDEDNGMITVNAKVPGKEVRDVHDILEARHYASVFGDSGIPCKVETDRRSLDAARNYLAEVSRLVSFMKEAQTK